MLDTIALTLKQSAFEVMDMDAFSPSARNLYQPPYYSLGKRGYVSCVQNPLKSELAQGLYKPRLTLTKRAKRGGYDYSLRIEFSAPKLKFGNNFEELSNGDFCFLLNILYQALTQMGHSHDAGGIKGSGCFGHSLFQECQTGRLYHQLHDYGRNW